MKFAFFLNRYMPLVSVGDLSYGLYSPSYLNECSFLIKCYVFMLLAIILGRQDGVRRLLE